MNILLTFIVSFQSPRFAIFSTRHLSASHLMKLAKTLVQALKTCKEQTLKLTMNMLLTFIFQFQAFRFSILSTSHLPCCHFMKLAKRYPRPYRLARLIMNILVTSFSSFNLLDLSTSHLSSSHLMNLAKCQSRPYRLARDKHSSLSRIYY